VAALAALIYAATLAGGFVLDDVPTVVDNPVVNGSVPLWEAFIREFRGNPIGGRWYSSYRPVTVLSFGLVQRVVDAAWAHHLVNVLLYAGLCFQVTRFSRRWLPGSWPVVAGLAFAVLPVHVESVASLVGRADVIAAILCVGAMELSLPRDDDEVVSVPRIVGAAGLYLLAMLAKESVALLPGVVGWFLLVRYGRGWTVRRLLPAVGLGVAGLGYLALRHAVMPVGLPEGFIGADNQLMDVPYPARAWGNLAVLGQYAELVLIPLRLCADHTYADVLLPSGPFDGPARWAWLGLLLLVVPAMDFRRALRGESAGLWVAAFVAYLLIGQWLILLSVIVAERLLLWPSVLLVVAATDATRRNWDRLPRRAMLGIAVAVGLGFALRSADRARDWRDQVSLFESSARVCPAAVHNRVNLAHAYRDAGRPLDAVWHFGVGAAGRMAYPDPFYSPAFEVEWNTPVQERLPRLPELTGHQASPFWAGLEALFVQEGWLQEAAVVRKLRAEAASG
jgi:hypothetical protein